MSRLNISNRLQLMQHIATLLEQASHDRHRALLIVESPPEGCMQGFAATAGCPFLAAEHNADRADRITGILGREFGILVHESHEIVDAGLLAALAGTVRAGGVLILGLPFPIEGQTASPCLPPPISRFNQRLARLLLQTRARHPSKIGLIAGQALCPASTEDAIAGSRLPGQETSETLAPPTLPRESRLPEAAAAREQDALLHAAISHLQTHPRSCMTICGRRGRGKSALLGRIANWLQQQNVSVAMTAARRSALDSVASQVTGLPFVAAADAAHSGCRVLLVDEAASLPLDVLMQYLQQHEHVIYCTTVEGYEQAGRAFEIRFTEMLARQRRKLLSLQPRIAWRWAAGDPLEEFIDTLLLTDPVDEAEPQAERHAEWHARGISGSPAMNDGSAESGSTTPSTPSTPSDSPADSLISRLDRTTLAHDEALLRRVFALLRDSHYQTSASDIAHLLDGPGLQIWVLEQGQELCAALLLAVEGDIDPELHEAIVSKQRRLPQQLLPQLLAQSANRSAPLQARMGRVIRIAVTPGQRRKGLGSLLLQGVERALTPPAGDLAALGASFAGDSAKLAFWQANGFTRFHTGFRRNPRTGTQAVAVLKAGEDPLAETLREASRIHDDNQLWLQGKSGNVDRDPADSALLQRFANAQRSLMDSYAAVSRLAMNHPLTLDPPDNMSRRKHEATLRVAVQRILQSDSALAQQ